MFGFINGKCNWGFGNVFVKILYEGLVSYKLLVRCRVLIDFVVWLVGFCFVGICVYWFGGDDRWIWFILFDI